MEIGKTERDIGARRALRRSRSRGAKPREPVRRTGCPAGATKILLKSGKGERGRSHAAGVVGRRRRPEL